MNNGAVTFSECTVIRRDLVFITAQIADLNRQGIGHTKVIRWKNDAFAHFMIDWTTTAITSFSNPLALFCMGLDGDIHVFHAGTKSHEVITGPGDIGPLRDMRVIDGANYAAGMQRQVYRRSASGTWQSLSTPILNKGSIKGFNSIDGYSSNEIYAVGLDGEIWFFNGSQWHPIDSPTSVSLQRIHCCPSGRAYIVGQAGVVIVGRGDQWATLDLGDFSDDLWGVETLNGEVFVSSSKAVFKLVDESLELAPIGSEGIGSASFLSAGDGVLWSVGSRHLAFTIDGKYWTPVDYNDAAY